VGTGGKVEGVGVVAGWGGRRWCVGLTLLAFLGAIRMLCGMSAVCLQMNVGGWGEGQVCGWEGLGKHPGGVYVCMYGCQW
jgi:hypothetical protein